MNFKETKRKMEVTGMNERGLGFAPVDWVSLQSAGNLARVSKSWIQLLGASGQVETCETPDGTLYNRDDVQRAVRELGARPSIDGV